MPSTVSDLLKHACLEWSGVVEWGNRSLPDRPGIYLVSLIKDQTTTDSEHVLCPHSMPAIERWLSVRPELRLDGRRPTPEHLAERVAGSWLPDESILYIGLAGTSLAKRVTQYYKTPLGARAPHAGGHFLKTLTNLEELYVHVAISSDPAESESVLLETFARNVDPTYQSSLHDALRPLPFANLAWPGHGRKLHGITGSKEARRSSLRSGDSTRASANPQVPGSGGTQPTLHDEISRILRARGGWMTTAEIAEAVNKSARYAKRDGSPVDAFQIHGRTRNYPHLFVRDGVRVRLA